MGILVCLGTDFFCGNLTECIDVETECIDVDH